MHSVAAMADSRLLFWRRVREFAVPPSMIESATARRRAGDWAGACAAARVDVDLPLRAVGRAYGQDLATRIRADLRRLAPDLLRWHLPRVAPDGLLRPGLTVTLARYDRGDGNQVHLVARTPPAWADGGQRISLAVWDHRRCGPPAPPHPHPHPDRRFRLDLHRHLWDADRADELPQRAGSAPPPDPVRADLVPWLERGCAVHRWADEATLLLDAEASDGGTVAVRLGGRRRLHLEVGAGGLAVGAGGVRAPAARKAGADRGLPVLPDAATWLLPDLELLRAGLIEADRLHPLVAAALVPGRARGAPPPVPEPAGGPHVVPCRGAEHRIALVDGVLTALDHDPAEVRREELLAELTGTPLPCLRAIDQAHRHPECLPEVRTRLDHGDTAGALAIVEALLGPDAVMRAGALRAALAGAVERRVAYGAFRLGVTGRGPTASAPRRTADRRSHPRHTTAR